MRVFTRGRGRGRAGLLHGVAERRPGHHVLGAEVRELDALQQHVGERREGIYAQRQRVEEDVEAGAGAGHEEAHEPEDEEPDDHPQGVAAASRASAGHGAVGDQALVPVFDS